MKTTLTLLLIACMMVKGFAQNNLHSDSLGGYTGNAITLTGNPYTGLVYIDSSQTTKTDTPLTDTVKTILLVIDTSHYTTEGGIPYYITGAYWMKGYKIMVNDYDTVDNWGMYTFHPSGKYLDEDKQLLSKGIIVIDAR